ncbi:MAG TPA: condensation domain-containing protein, partial [Longimicrobiaceae bacterium]|nr:condensation domain-containing protein [Longimicrobiaceae bacterium]
LPLRAFFEAPTLAAMAEAVEALRRAGLPRLPPVVPAGRTGALPLSFAQERLWFLSRLGPESAFYNIPTVLRLRGALAVRVLETALGEIVRRHEPLRTVFREVGGAPVQVVAPFCGWALPVRDLSGLGGADAESEARRLAAEDAVRPFDLVAGPHFRPALLRLAGDDHVLLLCMHHVAGDEWSMGVFFREMSALYGAYLEGRPSPLPEPAVQYADYAAWQREQLRGEALAPRLAWWVERLAGAPALLELPTDHPRPAVQSHRGAGEAVELPGGLLERLQALGRREGATLYMTLLGAFQVLLARYAGTEDVVVGSPIAGRTRPEVEELIGFFVNTLALRTDLSGDPTFREVLARVREATLGAYEHQDLPFERLVEELQPERSLGHSPLFQTMFVLQDAERPAGGLPGLELREVATERGTSKFDLTLALAAHPGGITGVLEYATDLFERGTILRMLGHLERVLEQVAGDAGARLGELELLGEAERRQLLEEWSRADAEQPAPSCVHELFQARAGRTPDAPALAAGGEVLTCGELDRRANRLAHHLLRLGVGPETRVAVCMERGAELVVSLLAVLKAGGAYVPLDPGLPAERLAWMLADSGARVLLTRGGIQAALPPHGARTVCVEAEAERIAAERADDPAGGAGPGSAAYVIYTSGSTGTPKGVLVEHGSLARLVAWHLRAFAPGPGDRATLLAGIGFDASAWELWPNL